MRFAVDHKVYDGRFANNAWLQELPHPITKLTWDNAVLISPRPRRRRSALEDRRRRRGRATATGASTRRSCVVPGHADDVVTLPLGYGREGAETVAKGVGFNAGRAAHERRPLVRSRREAGRRPRRGYEFAITQDHWTMAPDGRETPPPAVEATIAEVLETEARTSEELEERRPSPSAPQPVIHEPVDYSDQAYKWAMAIDLDKCTGCSACVVACQSENNIPVVGKENVRKGREMQWLRIDRYFTRRRSTNPEVIIQPLACVHCETAPCEYVCPVNATVHSDEGLNEMVYNRCIGTRYCSNNCPYKVRRFNFLDYTSDYTAAREDAA